MLRTFQVYVITSFVVRLIPLVWQAEHNAVLSTELNVQRQRSNAETAERLEPEKAMNSRLNETKYFINSFAGELLKTG